MSFPASLCTLWDDGHIAEGDGGHLQPWPAGHQLAFSVQGNRSQGPGVTGSLGTAPQYLPLTQLSTQKLRWMALTGLGVDGRLLDSGEGQDTQWMGMMDSYLLLPFPQLSLQPMGRVQPVTFLLFVLQNKLQKAEHREPAGISWADIYFDSGFSLPASFLGT